MTYEINNQEVLKMVGKAVVKLCKQTGEYLDEYKSALEAERLTSVFRSEILKCCKGKAKSAGGFKWIYLDDFIGEQEEYVWNVN